MQKEPDDYVKFTLLILTKALCRGKPRVGIAIRSPRYSETNEDLSPELVGQQD